jgi:glycosyltransferase involved in cell wall biosynthesis
MNILIVHKTKLPITKYGGTERSLWYLGWELNKMGHNVNMLLPKGSSCPFANVFFIQDDREIIDQIPPNMDVIHFSVTPKNIHQLTVPYITVLHGNVYDNIELDINTVFVSANHAIRYGSASFVYNGMNWDDYSKPDLNNARNYFHFLANASWSVKNVKGAINIIKKTSDEKLYVLGGHRLNFNMGFRFTTTPRARFCGMVGGERKDALVNQSKGLIFPVKWNEPFGIALIESLYYGCPVFATPYGSLKELIHKEVGALSNKLSELAEAVENAESFSKKTCHEYARDCFNSKVMAVNYLKKYETVIAGESLNPTKPKLVHYPEPKFLDWIE